MDFWIGFLIGFGVACWFAVLAQYLAYRYVRRRPWFIPEPFHVQVRETWCRLVWCQIVGHRYVVKMDGTRLCERH